MKAKSLETLAREAEREIPINALPKIAYNTALASRFMWDGQLHSVGTCDLAILHGFLSHYGYLALPSHPAYVEDALSCLDIDYGELGRWQAIDTLLLHKVVLPLR